MRCALLTFSRESPINHLSITYSLPDNVRECRRSVARVETDGRLHGIDEWHAVESVGFGVDFEFAGRNGHPSLPRGVAWSVERVFAVALGGEYAHGFGADSLHGSEAYIALAAAFWAHVGGYLAA